jgi:thioredoxin-related protein
MKKIIVVAFLIFSSLSIQAQELKWETDVKKALEVSVKTKKPILLFFTGSDWCGWCIRLQKEVFRTPEFTKWANENVVLVELDFPRNKPLTPELQKQNYELQQVFGVQGYPTVWFVNGTQGEDGKVNFDKLGSQGYVAGGPSKWLEGANKMLANKKP